MQVEKYYLYRHIRLDKYEPFYIGIGKKFKNFNTKKQEFNRAYFTYNRNNIWKRITNKTTYKVEILLESNNLEYIKNKEIEFIKLYGRIDLKSGTLSNLTDGGELNSNRVKSKEHILNLKLGLKKYWNNLSEEQKQKRKINSIKHITKAKLKYLELGCPKKYKNGRPHIDKKVINLETGIIHDSIKEVYESYNLKISKSHLTAVLAGKYTNNTNFKLI